MYTSYERIFKRNETKTNIMSNNIRIRLLFKLAEKQIRLAIFAIIRNRHAQQVHLNFRHAKLIHPNYRHAELARPNPS